MRTIIYGPPGTGKTYTLLKHIEEFLTNTDSLCLPTRFVEQFKLSFNICDVL